MIQAYLYDNDYNTLQTIELPIDYKLEYILCNHTKRILVGYNSTTRKFVAYKRYDSQDYVSEIASGDIYNISVKDMLDYNIFSNEAENKIIFIYSFINEDNKVQIAYFIFDNSYNLIESKLFDDNFIVNDTDIINIKTTFREPDDSGTKKEVIDALISVNDKFYIYNLNESKLINSHDNIEGFTNNFQFINIKTSKTEENVYDEVMRINNNVIPLIFIHSNYSVLIFLNNYGETIGTFYINKIFNNIKNVIMEQSEQGGIDICIYYDDDGSLFVDTVNISSSNIYEDIFRLDTEIIVTPGSENSNKKNIIAIRSHNFTMNTPTSQQIFLSKDIDVEQSTVVAKDDDREITVDKIDDGKVGSDQYYEDEPTIRRELYGEDASVLKEVISNPYLTNVDAFDNNSKIDKYDPTRYKETVIAQQFEKDNLGSIIVAKSDEATQLGRNTYEVTNGEVDGVKNIAVTISGKNTNVATDDNENYIIQGVGDKGIKLNEITNVVLPFIKLTFRKFRNVNIQDREMSLIFNKFNNYVTISENDRDGKVFKNELINNIVEFLYDELNYDSDKVIIEKSQLYKYIGQYFETDTNGKDILALGTSDEVYKYIDSIDGYKFN